MAARRSRVSSGPEVAHGARVARELGPVLCAVLALALSFTGLAPAAAGAPSAALAARPAPGGPGVPPIPGATAEGPFYLAVGASESLGVQPRRDVAGDHGEEARGDYSHAGAPTRLGYANDVVRAERSRWPGLHLVQLGCSGITAQGSVDGAGPCAYPAGSQVATAVQFLRAHKGGTVLASVDLGYNDLWPCLVHRRVNRVCVHATFRAVRQVIPEILRRLRAAGGRRTVIVGLEHNDPVLADWLHRGPGRTFAERTIPILRKFNQELSKLYRAGGGEVANVPRLWRVGSSHMVPLAGHGQVPADVATVCKDSWACSLGNVHPNAAGYRKIAAAITAAIASRPADRRPRAEG
ncbi:MAG TPA: hypothetical protein VND62_08075 [Acidimicrobiales bacterium]|nr:hypothetical protein [Acidimicrobiales bacterium]